MAEILRPTPTNCHIPARICVQSFSWWEGGSRHHCAKLETMYLQDRKSPPPPAPHISLVEMHLSPASTCQTEPSATQGLKNAFKEPTLDQAIWGKGGIRVANLRSLCPHFLTLFMCFGPRRIHQAGDRDLGRHGDSSPHLRRSLQGADFGSTSGAEFGDLAQLARSSVRLEPCCWVRPFDASCQMLQP